MKILKHGSLDKRKFVCDVCGCEFVAETGEYTITKASGITLWYSIYCPYCDSYVDKSEPYEEKDDGLGLVLSK